MKNFIFTQDKETADKLVKLGYNLISQSGNSYTFENCLKLNFSDGDIDTTKIVHTNTFCM